MCVFFSPRQPEHEINVDVYVRPRRELHEHLHAFGFSPAIEGVARPWRTVSVSKPTFAECFPPPWGVYSFLPLGGGTINKGGGAYSSARSTKYQTVGVVMAKSLLCFLQLPTLEAEEVPINTVFIKAFQKHVSDGVLGGRDLLATRLCKQNFEHRHPAPA